MSSVHGVIVSVLEKESPGEGLKVWEVIWRVTDFLQLVGSDGGWYSPDFRWTGQDGRETVSRLGGVVRQVAGVDWLSVWHDSGNTKTKATLCLLARDQVEHHLVSEEEFYAGGRVLNFLPWSRVVEQQANLLSSEGNSTIIYRFQAVVGELGRRTPAVYGEPSLVGNHFGQLYRSGDMSDVKILVSEQVFPAHLNILAARSPVLSAMLHSDMIEATSGQISIPDSAPGPVDTFLKYLYSGTITFNDDIHDILHLADKYQVEDLKEICISVLSDTLSVTNAVDYLELAGIYSLTDLRKRIVSLFKEHREILNTEPWKALMASNPALTTEILMELLAII